MLEVNNLSKLYPGFSLTNVSFTVNKGDYYILLGPSGSGKSLILQIISGLVKPDAGNIMLNGKNITHSDIHRRNIGLMFQDNALFPHMTVRENIAYPLKLRKYKQKDIRHRVGELAEEVSIGHLLDRSPASLSGGEIQRVSIARNLASKPEIVLLDEPLTSLDIQLKHDIRILLKDLNRRGQTIVHVTHDFEDAIVLANMVTVIKEGQAIQSGTKNDVFHHPGSEFVARFTGIKNYFEADLKYTGDLVSAQLPNDIQIRVLPGERMNKATLMIPSMDIILSENAIKSSITNSFHGVVTGYIPLFNGYEVVVDIGIILYCKISGESFAGLGINTGVEIYVSFKAASVRLIPS